MTDWRNRLRGDPASWLLDAADNPSVTFWFLHDIVGRPENAPNLVHLREQILYSEPLQNILARQDPDGFWESAASLDLPLHRATLWTLALLAELGAPRQSRRARAACEFVLQNHWTEQDDFSGLSDAGLSGLLIHALSYFLGQDARVFAAARRLAQTTDSTPRSLLFTLWCLSDIPMSERPPGVSEKLNQDAEQVLDGLTQNAFPKMGAFPSFDPADLMLALRLLAAIGRLNDSRAQSAIERVWQAQGEGGRWTLEKTSPDTFLTETEQPGLPNKWATLNALRLVTRIATRE